MCDLCMLVVFSLNQQTRNCKQPKAKNDDSLRLPTTIAIISQLSNIFDSCDIFHETKHRAEEKQAIKGINREGKTVASRVFNLRAPFEGLVNLFSACKTSPLTIKQRDDYCKYLSATITCNFRANKVGYPRTNKSGI